jgi:hypothetical protein
MVIGGDVINSTSARGLALASLAGFVFAWFIKVQRFR